MKRGSSLCRRGRGVSLDDEQEHGAFVSVNSSLRIAVAVDSNARAFLCLPLSIEATALLFKAMTLLADIIADGRKVLLRNYEKIDRVAK
jgi:hypothetical protein